MCIASHPFPASETVQSPKQTCLRPTVAPPPSPRFHAATYVLLRTAHGLPPYLQLTTTPVRDTPACLYLIRDPRYVHFLVIMFIDRSLSPIAHLLGGSGRRHSDVSSLCSLLPVKAWFRSSPHSGELSAPGPSRVLDCWSLATTFPHPGLSRYLLVARRSGSVGCKQRVSKCDSLGWQLPADRILYIYT